MQVICETVMIAPENEPSVCLLLLFDRLIINLTLDIQKQLKLHGLECLVKVADLYYTYLPDYMSACCQVCENILFRLFLTILSS